MTHCPKQTTVHEETVPNKARSGTKNGNTVQVHINRQPDLIPESLVGEVTYDVYTSRQQDFNKF